MISNPAITLSIANIVFKSTLVPFVISNIVENSLVVESLLAEVGKLDNIDFICPVSVAKYNQSDSQVSVELSSGETLAASLLVAADGGNSSIREQFKFATREWDYGHSAIVTTVQTESVHQQTAWQRFMPTGPLALLPLDKQGDHHRCSLVWSQESDEAERLMALNDDAFCAELGYASEYCLGEILAVDKRYAIPLRQRHAKDYVVERVALLGDAAHTIHPLAGQGQRQMLAGDEAFEQAVRFQVQADHIPAFLHAAQYAGTHIGQRPGGIDPLQQTVPCRGVVQRLQPWAAPEHCGCHWQHCIYRLISVNICLLK